jgi:hypothetical protein
MLQDSWEPATDKLPDGAQMQEVTWEGRCHTDAHPGCTHVNMAQHHTHELCHLST